jgi:hypothetical protein
MLAAMLKSMNRVLAATITQAGQIIALKDVIKLTGGMVDPEFIALKEREILGFRFEPVADCPLLGNVALCSALSRGSLRSAH